ncbi:MAG TPA: hypothetical protein VF062_20075, partial [Candidatus Limnocylindrales bacterium]
AVRHGASTHERGQWLPEYDLIAMGSKYVSVYVADLREVARRVGSRDRALAERLTRDIDAALAGPMRLLIDGGYAGLPKASRDQVAPGLIQACQVLCHDLCRVSATIEVYDDEVATPLLWEFLWSGWDGDDPLALPYSPYGVPAVVWHGPRRIAAYRNEFVSLRANDVYDRRYLPPSELDALINLFDAAVALNSGAFVFADG